MAFLTTENASSSSSIPPSSTLGCKYECDVFLSFRGPDTRNTFTDHLYDGLKRVGISTFRDDERLEQGTEINSGLLRAIDESKIAVVVLSKQYASSSWCLMELAKIVECMDKKKLTVLPVFHYVDPSDVRYQRGSFKEDFAKHEYRFKDKIDVVETWRAALTKVANLYGYHIKDNSESEVIKEIIQRINSELDPEVPLVSEHLVGMDSRVKELLDLCLAERLDCVRLVGICGMGGIGKTTLAREIYNRIFRNFEASSFIADVREEFESRRLVSLQKNILSKILMGAEKSISDVEEGKKILRKSLCNKKVLIVLDDVNDDEQLKALARKDWFGLGSIIIVTSRDSHLLNTYWDGVIDIYRAKGLNDDEALELFSLKAFKKPHPEKNYVDLSINFVSYANGLPLALRVLGSSLFDKTLDAWRSARDKLGAKPNRAIMDVLEMSVVGLDDTQRDLFLDIACFFNGMDNYCIRDTLESLGHYSYDIDVLQDKSLITIASDGALGMHDLLKEMGQDIVRRKSPKEPSKRSRLWSYEDVLHVLTSNAGTEVVKGIMLNMPIEAKERLSAKAFSKMKILRFLKIGYVYPPRDCIRGPIMLNELKLIDLSDSQNLIEIPNLSEALNLKQLILQRCTRLYNIHASLGDLKRLIRLDLNGCKCLKCLPHKINLEALEFFNLSGCSKLEEFPYIVENMPRLWKLCLSETAIKDLSLLVIHSTGLIELDLRDCKNLSSLPIAICSLMSLKTLNLSGCSKLDELPENLGKIEGLEVLDLSWTAITSLPSSVVHFKNLKVLSLYGCVGMLERSSMGLCSLTKLDLSDSQNLIEIPNLSRVPNLKQLILQRCTRLYKIHTSLGDLKRLTHLDLNGCKCLKSLPHKISLEALEFFNLSGCSKLEEFPYIVENMPRLWKLCLSETVIKDLSLLVIHSTGLIELELRDCKNLSSLPIAICSLMSLKTLNLSGCSKLDKLPENLEKIEGLEKLDLSETAITGLPSSIVHVKNLKVLSPSGCVGLSFKCSRLWSYKDVLHVLTSNAGTEVVEVPHLDSDWVDLAAMDPFHPVDQKDKGSQSPPSQSPYDQLSWARKEARWKEPHDRSYLVRKEARWIGRLNLNLNLKPSQLLIIDWGLKTSPSQLLIIDLELMMSRKLESLPMMMDWGIKLPSQMRVMMLPSQMRAMMNLDSQMRAIGETEEAESPQSSTKLKRLESSSPCSSTKWKRLYLKIVESEIKEAESLPSELLAEPSERNKLYFFFWHAYSPVMYSLYEVDVPIPLPPPPSKAVQDDRISNPKSLSPILKLETGKYPDGMCCVQLGSILYFLGGEMNIDNPYIDEEVKKKLKNVEPDVLPKVVYIFDLAIDREVKDNDDLLTRLRSQ
ncbi:TMV resistance protein N-like [Castanea sativa]|uniref:TMV resistance protein N-like n=1 Tax=Castanea sativa TaxID=21020 RepID=UPI003F64DC31